MSSFERKLPTFLPSIVDYFRISVTDRCNEKCLYCLPENFSAWTPKEAILTFEEILQIVENAVSLGFKHFRVTGGEPLLRRGVESFIKRLVDTPGVESVQLTTNGTRLPLLAKSLVESGLKSINISLDAIDPAKYRAITHGDIAPVLKGIELLKQLGFPSIKLNTVLIRGKNEDQILPLIHFAAKRQISIRFIELMPLSLTSMLDESNFFPIAEAQKIVESIDELEPHHQKIGHGPARYFRLRSLGALVGFIGAITNLHFCENCNKIRLTADGKLRPCLGNHGEFDLMSALRPQLNKKHLSLIMQEALDQKPPEHLFRNNYQPQRIMTAIGG